MKFSLFYTKRAQSDLGDLDPLIAKRILNKINSLVAQPNPIIFAKKLTNPSIGQYRFRIGNYRVIFDLDKQGHIIILVILTIKHRREAYRI